MSTKKQEKEKLVDEPRPSPATAPDPNSGKNQCSRWFCIAMIVITAFWGISYLLIPDNSPFAKTMGWTMILSIPPCWFLLSRVLWPFQDASKKWIVVPVIVHIVVGLVWFYMYFTKSTLNWALFSVRTWTLYYGAFFLGLTGLSALHFMD